MKKPKKNEYPANLQGQYIEDLRLWNKRNDQLKKLQGIELSKYRSAWDRFFRGDF